MAKSNAQLQEELEAAQKELEEARANVPAPPTPEEQAAADEAAKTAAAQAEENEQLKARVAELEEDLEDEREGVSSDTAPGDVPSEPQAGQVRATVLFDEISFKSAGSPETHHAKKGDTVYLDPAEFSRLTSEEASLPPADGDPSGTKRYPVAAA